MPNTQSRTPRVDTGYRPNAMSNRQIGGDILGYAKEYAREKPEVAALWCFGIGFIVGWKLKPW